MNTLLELLEPRIAPAVLVNPSTVTYQDVDGDLVTVKFSRPIFSSAAEADTVFAFSNSDTVSAGNNGTPTQLQSIDLSALNNPLIQGIDITITAKKTPGNFGDGIANVGEISSSGANNYNLGKVSVSGDLGRIEVGDTDPSTPRAITSLSAGSMGLYGTATQDVGGNLVSKFFGGAGTISIKGDLRGAELLVMGDLGSFNTKGSLIGGDTSESGRLAVAGNTGSVVIGGDLVGGAGSLSGRLVFTGTGTVGSISIGGSVIGGSGSISGSIYSNNDITSLTIKGEVIGSSGSFSGFIDADGSSIKTLAIGGSLIGGTGIGSGRLEIDHGGTSLSIGGDMIGGAGDGSGTIAVNANESLNTLTIKGSVYGGNGNGSGSLSAMDAVVAKTIVGGNVVGAQGIDSGMLKADFGASVSIGGSLIGGTGLGSGSIIDTNSAVTFTTVFTIKGDLRGSGGSNSGSLISEGIVSLMLGKSLIGGSGDFSGSVIATTLGFQQVTIGGNVIGGSGYFSGNINGNTVGVMPIKQIDVKGGLYGSTGVNSGVISISGGGTISKLSIGKDVRGGSITGLFSTGTTGCIYVHDAFVSNASIGGSIIAGSVSGGGVLSDSGIVSFGGGVGKFALKGNLLGSTTNMAEIRLGVLASPTATNYNVANTLTIGGSVISGNILAGYDASGPVSGNVAIGKMSIGGNFIGSNIAVGVEAGGDGLFGTNDDSLIGTPTLISRIASLQIKGFAFGSTNTAEQYGVVAAGFGSVSVAGVNYPTNPGSPGFQLNRLSAPPLNGSVVLRVY